MEQQLSALLKQQLRDVHLPAEVSWWPLAYGWWILIVLSALGVTALIYYFFRNRKQNAYRHSAIRELNIAYTLCQQKNDVAAYLQSANAILKRSVLHFSKQHDAASQSGQAWLNTLARSTSGELSLELKDALASQVYRANAQADINLVHRELCNWLRTHQTKARLPMHGSNRNSTFENSELKKPEASDA